MYVIRAYDTLILSDACTFMFLWFEIWLQIWLNIMTEIALNQQYELYNVGQIYLDV